MLIAMAKKMENRGEGEEDKWKKMRGGDDGKRVRGARGIRRAQS